MLGGELVATGSSSCVFTPNLPCKQNSSIKNDRISKIVYSEDAKSESKDEKRMNTMIKKIKGYSKWSLIFDEYCKPMNSDVLKTYDPSGMEDCFNEEEEIYLIDNFDKNSYMMNGMYGGITLSDYFEDVFYNKTTMNNTFKKSFYTLMEKMEPLFLGLKVMNDKKIVHNDIKYNNIVLHDNVFKYIDFGLSEKSSKKTHFKNRSLDELNSGRIYLFYPLEYLLYYANKSKIKKEVYSVNYGNPRRNIYNLDHVMRLYMKDILNTYDNVSSNLFNKKVSEKKMIEMIDVYSLGILVPLMFLFSTNFVETDNPSESFLKNILLKSAMIQEFFTLFGMMINDSCLERIKPEYAYKEFKRLLKKYKNGEKLSLKKSKKRKVISKKRVVSRNKKRNIQNKSLKQRYNITPLIRLRENKRRIT
jgi:serine/threonine protein kinase